jgi:hypothetical protein
MSMIENHDMAAKLPMLDVDNLKLSHNSEAICEPTCSKCGYCCFFFADGKVRKCRHLTFHITADGKTKTLCRIYNQPDRIGRLLYTAEDGAETRCMNIDGVLVNYPLCPYNERKNVKAGRELPMCSFRVKWIDEQLGVDD